MPRPSDDGARPAGPWRQPVVWLALAVFLASLAACIITIVVAVQASDPSDAVTQERLFKVPVTRAEK